MEKSSSIEQQMAEQVIFQKVNDWLGVELVENAKIFVGNTLGSFSICINECLAIGNPSFSSVKWHSHCE